MFFMLHVLSMAGFALTTAVLSVLTETLYPTKPKIFASGSLHKKFYQPLVEIILLPVIIYFLVLCTVFPLKSLV